MRHSPTAILSSTLVCGENAMVERISVWVTTIGTIVVIVVADDDFVGPVVAVMVALADGDVPVEHIDPDEQKNMTVLSAFEWIQA